MRKATLTFLNILALVAVGWAIGNATKASAVPAPDPHGGTGGPPVQQDPPGGNGGGGSGGGGGGGG